MRSLLPLFLFGILATSCVDSDYDLADIDTDGVTIGDEFKLPLATVTVSMNELSDGEFDIKALFDEADIWLPSPLPGGASFVDLEAIQENPAAITPLLEALIGQMQTDDAKINAVADLLYTKYLDNFLPLLPPGTDPQDFKPVFIEAFRNTPIIKDQLTTEVRNLAGSHLTNLKVDDVKYDIGKIDIGSDIVDMLAENLDPKETPEAQRTKTLHIYGEITSGLPVSLTLTPLFSPTEVQFTVPITPNVKNAIPKTQLFESDLRQIIDGAEIVIPVALEKYFPGSGFTPDQKIVISLRLVKKGGLKLNL